MADGYIPKKITYVIDKREKTKLKAKAVPSSASSSVKTAIKNLRGNQYSSGGIVEPEVITLENTPGDTYRLVKYQRWSQSYSENAYIVQNDEGWLFEIFAKDIAEIAINGTISEGRICDDVVWARFDRRTSLIRVGSTKYKELASEQDKGGTTGVVKAKDLEEGRCYQTPSGQKYFIYLGYKQFLTRENTQLVSKEGHLFMESWNWNSIVNTKKKIQELDLDTLDVIPSHTLRNMISHSGVSLRNPIGKIVAVSTKIDLNKFLEKHLKITKYMLEKYKDQVSYYGQLTKMVELHSLTPIGHKIKIDQAFKDYYDATADKQYYKLENINNF